MTNQYHKKINNWYSCVFWTWENPTGIEIVLKQLRVIPSEEWKRDPKQISHNALANCAMLTRGENYFLTHVITAVHKAFRNSFTVFLVFTIDFTAGKSSAAALAWTKQFKTPSTISNFDLFYPLIPCSDYVSSKYCLSFFLNLTATYLSAYLFWYWRWV